VSPNLVAIAGVPHEASPRYVAPRPRGVGAITDAEMAEEKSTMWLCLSVFGGAVIAGYFIGQRVVL